MASRHRWETVSSTAGSKRIRYADAPFLPRFPGRGHAACGVLRRRRCFARSGTVRATHLRRRGAAVRGNSERLWWSGVVRFVPGRTGMHLWHVSRQMRPGLREQMRWRRRLRRNLRRQLRPDRPGLRRRISPMRRRLRARNLHNARCSVRHHRRPVRRTGRLRKVPSGFLMRIGTLHRHPGRRSGSRLRIQHGSVRGTISTLPEAGRRKGILHSGMRERRTVRHAPGHRQ